jgi:hypothetical protein
VELTSTHPQAISVTPPGSNTSRPSRVAADDVALAANQVSRTGDRRAVF